MNELTTTRHLDAPPVTERPEDIVDFEPDRELFPFELDGVALHAAGLASLFYSQRIVGHTNPKARQRRYLQICTQ